MKRNLLLIVGWCLLSLLFVEATKAQADNPQPPLTTEKPSSKLSPDLKSLYEAYAPQARNGEDKKDIDVPKEGLAEYLQIIDGYVLVDITIKENNEKTIDELVKMGFKVTAVFGRIASGMMPVKTLSQLETAASVKFVRPAYKPMHQGKPIPKQGTETAPQSVPVPVISQGDTAQRSYVARANAQINGAGVKLGILSDSYNHFRAAENGVTRGELPGPANPFGFVKPVQVLKDYDGGDAIDEGRAMAEIIHDVAPGAEIFFHTVIGGQAAFAQGILNLAAAGCKVVTDDIFYFAEPFFQDGIIAQAVDNVQQKGVTYFSSAGNNGARSYESDYRPTSITMDHFFAFAPPGTLHNFGAPDSHPILFQPVTIPTGGSFIISFQWDQPFFSAGGAGAQTDLDICLINAEGRVVAGGFVDNIATGDPVEVFGYNNLSPSTTFLIAILKYRGPNTSRLKYIIFGDGGFFPSPPAPPIPGINAPTLVGHPKAEGAIATAAAFYLQTPEYGVNPPVVEPFSALGGVPNYFDNQGNRIPPLIRRKPEITAPDGGNTSFFTQDITLDSDPFPNFFGTSASVAHAAGVAALMIEAQKLNTLTPTQIRDALSAHTVDMDNQYTPGFDAGFDFNTGTGLIKADAAVNAVRTFQVQIINNLTVESLCSSNPAVTRNWKIINPNPVVVPIYWYIVATSIQGNLMVQPGETILTTPTGYYNGLDIPNFIIISWQDHTHISRSAVGFSTGETCSTYLVAENVQAKKLNNSANEKAAAKENTVTVTPNPASRNFRINLSFVQQQNVDLELYNLEGRRMLKKTVPAKGVVEIDASRYTPGIYLLKARQGPVEKVLKLIKQ